MPAGKCVPHLAPYAGNYYRLFSDLNIPDLAFRAIQDGVTGATLGGMDAYVAMRTGWAIDAQKARMIGMSDIFEDLVPWLAGGFNSTGNLGMPSFVFEDSLRLVQDAYISEGSSVIGIPRAQPSRLKTPHKLALEQGR